MPLSATSGHYDIARRYATAFYALATEQSQTEQITQDMQALQSAITTGDDFAAFLDDPSVARAAQTKAVLAVAKHLKVSALTEKLLGTLAEKRRLPALAAVVAEVQRQIAEQKGEITATVTAAQALDQSQLNDIATHLKKMTGKDVRVALEIDAEIVGGLVIRVGSKLIDSSVRTKLERLHRALKTTNSSSDKTKMKEVA
jgi:F-type H+-transporting ATPase subunit delta